MKHDRLILLLSAHAKLLTAADLVRWSLSAEAAKIMPYEELKDVEAKLRRWSREAFRAAYEKEK